MEHSLWSVSSGEEAKSHRQHPCLQKSLIFMEEEAAVLIWHTAHSGQPVQEVAVFTGHLHVPLSATRVGRGLYSSSVIDPSSTAECRLSLCISQLLCECQLHAGTAHQPLPFLSTTNFHFKETIKERDLCFAGLGQTWGAILYVCSCLIWGFFHPKKTKQITSNKNIHFSFAWSHRH